MSEATKKQTVKQVRTNAMRALRRLAEWEPEGGFPDHCDLAYADSFTPAQVKEELDRCNAAPFFSEAFLYELLGKEDARTLMSLLNSVARSLGHQEGVC